MGSGRIMDGPTACILQVSSLVPGLLVTALTAKSNISFLYVGFTLRNECSKVLAVTFRYMS